MISALLRYWNSLEIAQVRQRRLPGLLSPHVPKGAHVLDVGSGNGYIASHMLRDGKAASVKGIDVLLYPEPLVPTIAFDGMNVPYADRSFDLVTLVDVLHHSDDAHQLLREAVRVSRGRILIKDHYWISRLDRWILHFADYLGNKAYNVSLPYNFLRMEQWAEMFNTLGLSVVSTEQFHYSTHDRAKQVIFVVEPIAPTSPSAAAARSDEWDVQPAQ